VNIPCKVCGKKRARRRCPGIGGDICPSCCGAEREVSIDCPLDCEFLRDARRHERPPDIDLESVPNQDIRVTEDFLREKEYLVLWLGNALARAMESGKTVDADSREALEAIIRTYRTRESGLIYETRPQNPYAAGLQDEIKQAVESLAKRVADATGVHSLRDSDVLGTLVFLQRLEYQHNNGRRRGRAFFDFLTSMFPAAPPESAIA
jgi:hypothetical protein